MSSQLSSQEKLAKIIKLVELALSKLDARLIKFNQKDKTLNLLLVINEDGDIGKISSIIWNIEVILKLADISIVKLYQSLEGQPKPECFSTLDLNQPIINTEEENPFFQENLTSNSYTDELTCMQLKSISTINPNLGLRQRANLGDVQAIKQLLDVALIHRNATTIVRLENNILDIIVESENEHDQQTVVLVIKRQLDLLNKSIFFRAKISGNAKGKSTRWSENICFETLAVKVNKSTDFAKTTKKLANFSNKSNVVAIGGVLVLSVGLFLLFTQTSVPDVTGQQVNNAQGILKGKNINVKVIEQVEEDVTPGQVMSQNPPPRRFFFSKGDTVEVIVAKAPTYTITGEFILLDSDIGGSISNCYGTGGYSDIRANMAVTVKDGTGNILATETTGIGRAPDTFTYKSKVLFVTCQFDFSINVPKADFYSISIGRRGELNYSLEEMKANGWKVSLSLGS